MTGLVLVVAWLPLAIADGGLPQSAVPRSLLLQYLADNSIFTLVDARSEDEYSASHIPGAINLPHDTADESFATLPPASDAMIVVYCKTGKRASSLKARLTERGYENVRVLSPERIFWFDEMAVFNCGTDDNEPLSEGIAGMLNERPVEERE